MYTRRVTDGECQYTKGGEKKYMWRDERMERTDKESVTRCWEGGGGVRDTSSIYLHNPQRVCGAR